MDIEKAYDKISKLNALAQKTTHKGERGLAIAKVNQIMRRYGISEGGCLEPYAKMNNSESRSKYTCVFSFEIVVFPTRKIEYVNESKAIERATVNATRYNKTIKVYSITRRFRRINA